MQTDDGLIDQLELVMSEGKSDEVAQVSLGGGLGRLCNRQFGDHRELVAAFVSGRFAGVVGQRHELMSTADFL